ncbi:hypothetical protein K492DRAFT_206201 [Lichtheimia hyalospora FSU 10163]|nr:hypothetical protein K492DRAFT_206201 [Lichtheimia hyalospora FSU 10163]
MIPPEKPLYIRARRDKTVVFLCYQPSDTIATIKGKLCAAIPSSGKTADDIRLYIRRSDGEGYNLLNDASKANASGIQNETDIYYVYGDQGNWEQVHTSEYEPLDEGDEEMEEDNIPSSKKEKGKGRA